MGTLAVKLRLDPSFSSKQPIAIGENSERLPPDHPLKIAMLRIDENVLLFRNEHRRKKQECGLSFPNETIADLSKSLRSRVLFPVFRQNGYLRR